MFNTTGTTKLKLVKPILEREDLTDQEVRELITDVLNPKKGIDTESKIVDMIRWTKDNKSN